MTRICPPPNTTDEDDLHKITLTIDASLTTGTIKLEMIGHGAAYGSVKVWTNATKKTAVPLPKTWTLGQDTVPSELWVEGIVGSQNVRDVELKLSHVQQNISDSVRITVVPLIPVMATVEQSSNILKGAAWKPDGSYCLMAGWPPPGLNKNGRIGKYEYPMVLPTVLDSGQNRAFWQAGWKGNGTFALIGGTECILKYNGTTFVSIHNEVDRVFFDVAWKPGGDFAFIPAERPGHGYWCDGTTTKDLQMPAQPDGQRMDAHNADWQPNGDYVLCNGDTGCQWKWEDTGGLGAWTYILGNTVLGSNVTAFHPGGAFALVGCSGGRVYKYSDTAENYTRIRGSDDPYARGPNTAGICWQRQRNYAILAGSQRNDPTNPGRHVLLYNDGDSKFYDVDVRTDEKPFRRLAWHPTENYAVGAVHDYE